MRIILANKFYYPRGGDCTYTIGLEKLLKQKGHEVAVFSQQYIENLDNEFSKYWPSSVDYSAKKIKNIKETLFRPIFSREVSNKFTRLLDDFEPDVVHLNNIHSQISPIIAELANKKNIPVIWTLHDYKLLCPAYNFMRNGQMCELCLNNKFNVVKKNCIKNIIGSSLGYLESKKWNRKKIESITTIFISPSNFLKRKMIEGGYASDKINVLNNFIDEKKILDNPIQKKDYYLYFGRFTNEKGVKTLLESAKQLPFLLKLAGTGPLLEGFKKNHHYNNIEFLGFKYWDELKEIIKKAKFIVVPSEWYENNPYTIIEAFSLGTPVVGANIGGIPDLVINNETGILFESGNVDDLTKKIKYLFNNISLIKELEQNVIKFAKKNFSSENYYLKIMEIYNEAISISKIL